MLARIAGIFLILFGIIGMVVPLVPSIIPIIAGYFLFTKGKFPPFFSPKWGGFKIDWEWVRQEMLKKEKIDGMQEGRTKEAISSSLDRCLKRARSLVRPKVATVKKKISEITTDGIRLEGGERFAGTKIALYLKDASDAYLFVATIGDAVEKAATERMAAGDSLEGYLLDKIGSYAVESLAESVEKKLREHYEKTNQSVSTRFSPGYCDWAIEEQRLVDKITGFSKAGVQLTESCMMVPRKSISALVGIGARDIFPHTDTPCMVCNRRDCSYRREA